MVVVISVVVVEVVEGGTEGEVDTTEEEEEGVGVGGDKVVVGGDRSFVYRWSVCCVCVGV